MKKDFVVILIVGAAKVRYINLKARVPTLPRYLGPPDDWARDSSKSLR